MLVWGDGRRTHDVGVYSVCVCVCALEEVYVEENRPRQAKGRTHRAVTRGLLL